VAQGLSTGYLGYTLRPGSKVCNCFASCVASDNFTDKVFRALIADLLSRDEPPAYPGAISIWALSEDADTEGVIEYAPGMGPGSDYERSGSDTESEAESD
jgi:hypothetical protein